MNSIFSFCFPLNQSDLIFVYLFKLCILHTTFKFIVIFAASIGRYIHGTFVQNFIKTAAFFMI